MRSVRHAKSKYAVSALLTLAVIAVLVISGPVRAVDLSTSLPADALVGAEVEFDLEVDFRPGEIIPFQYAQFEVSGEESVSCRISYSGSLLAESDAACANFTFTPAHTVSRGDSTFGYGYSALGEVFDRSEFVFDTISFDTVFGYGYGAEEFTLRWNVVWDTAQFAAGDYTVDFFIVADDEDVSVTYATPAANTITLEVLSKSGLQQTTSSTSSADISLSTSIPATCRWSTSSSMSSPTTFENTDATTHSTTVGLSAGQTRTIYVQCESGGVFTSAQGFTVTTTSFPSFGGGGGGGGGGGAPPSSLPPQAAPSFNLGALISGEARQIVLTRDAIAFRNIVFESVRDMQRSLEVTVRSINENSAPALMGTRAYQYLELEYSDDFEAQNVDITFRVHNDWIAVNGIPADDVRLFRWQNNRWTEQPTSFVERDGDHWVFRATPSGLSFFAIGEREPPVQEPPVVPEEPEVVVEEEDTPTLVLEREDEEVAQEPAPVQTPERSGGTFLWTVLAIALLGLGIYGGMRYKRAREREAAYKAYQRRHQK